MIEAMKLALESLEDWKTYMRGHWDVIDEQAVTALRQAIAEFDSHTLYREGYVNGYAFGEAAGRKAIAEAEKHDGNCQQCGGKGCVACDAREQEPVMWVMPDGKTVDKWGLQFYGGQTGKPLYTHKHEWVGLTDEEVEELANPLLRNVGNAIVLASYEYFARAIEAKLKEKNT
jgi:hypothetical protein